MINQKIKVYTTLFALVCVFVVTSMTSAATTTNATAQAFGDDGVYGCKGAAQNPVGMEHAGGIFVPVAESAVSHNTNILVYKECVLDAIAARVRESLVAFMVKSTFNWANQTADGGPAFINNQDDMRLSTANKVVDETIKGQKTEVLFDSFKQDVRTVMYKNYKEATLKPESTYAPTVPDDKKDEYTNFLKGNGHFSWDMYLLAVQPQNNPLGAYTLAQDQMLSDVETKINDEYTEAGWGDGYKSQKECKQIPAGNGTYEEYCQIVTPGSTVKDIVNYVSLTGQRQTENADEVDELMGSLMNNIHTQILTSIGGMFGITKADSSGRSFVDQIAGDAASRTRAEYTDAGVNALSSAIATETAYGVQRRASKDTLESTAQKLITKESSCWDGLIARAKADLIEEAEEIACNALNNNQNNNYNTNSCPIQGSATVAIATSTIVYSDFDQAQQDGTGRKEYDVIITAQAANIVITRTLHRHANTSYDTIETNITPLLNVVTQSVNDSIKALAILANLQTNLLSSNTPGNTRFVLGQVDQLVASGALHKEGDVVVANSQHDKITDTMRELYDESVKAWDTGWCNPANWRDQIK